MPYLRTMIAAATLLLVFAFPAWGQDTTSSGACQNPQEVLTVGPTTENTRTPFTTTGNVFRVSYDVAFDDPEAFNAADIDIENRFGLVEFVNLSEDETNNLIVTEGAGSYDLVVEIDPPNGGTYTVTVEDCGVASQGNGDDQGTDQGDGDDTGDAGAGTAADDQYNDGGGNNDGGDVSNPKDVIPGTGAKKVPNTGGVPLLGLAVCALALAGVGFSVLRASIRRDL